MLQQILREMWVDPEILAELDDTQKQTLFCKMREEQVRRWQVWDDKISKDDGLSSTYSKNAKKHVQFLQGEDGEPWVWVMGEHSDDKSIETILAEETRQKALEQARQEAHQLRKSVEKELTQLIDYKPLDSLEQTFDISPKSIDPLEDSLDIYCTADELRIESLEPEVCEKLPEKENIVDKMADCNESMKMDLNQNKLHFNFIEGKRDVMQELSLSAGDAVMSRVAAWERRVAAARAGDILRGLRARRARTLRDAQMHADDDHEIWRERERKAKGLEAAMREIARAARDAHRRAAAPPAPALASPPSPPALAPAAASAPSEPYHSGKPSSKETVVEWFRNNEIKRGVVLDENNKVYDWFHGAVSRQEAERRLAAAAPGGFLVRLSARARGLVLSARAAERCKHYVVDAAAGYRLLGASHLTHLTLADLINYHKTVSITEEGGDFLLQASPPAQPPTL